MFLSPCKKQKTMLKTFFKIALICQPIFSAAIAHAQTSSGVKIPLPVQQMLRWKGKWEGKATLQINGKLYQSTYYADFKKTADGNGLYMDEHCNVPGVGNMKGANLIGYDPYDGKIHWYSVDNLGTTHEHVGEFTDNNNFYMEHNSVQEGKTYTEKINVDFKDDNTLLLKIIATLDGKVQEIVEATFHRKS